MIKDYNELFKRICTLAGKPVSEYQVFYEDWKKICSASDFDMVLKAWEHIKIEHTYYFKLKIWNDKLDVLEERKKTGQPDKKPTRVEKDDDMRAWKKNLDNFKACRITLKEYLGTALKIGQMKPHEFNIEVARYERLGYDFNKPIRGIGINLKSLSSGEGVG